MAPHIGGIQQPGRNGIDDDPDASLGQQFLNAAQRRHLGDGHGHDDARQAAPDQGVPGHRQADGPPSQAPGRDGPDAIADRRCQGRTHHAHARHQHQIEQEIDRCRNGHGLKQQPGPARQGEGLMEIVGRQPGHQGRQSDQGGYGCRRVPQLLADHQLRQRLGHQGQTGGGRQGNQQKGRGLFAGGGPEGTGPAALQGHDEGRPGGGSEPDEDHIQCPVRQAVSRVIGPHGGLIEKGGKNQAVCRRQHQRQDQGCGHRIAVAGIVAGPASTHHAPLTTAVLAGGKDEGCHEGHERQADQRGRASGPHGDCGQAHEKGTDGDSHVEAGGGGDRPGGPAAFLNEIVG